MTTMMATMRMMTHR